MSGSVEAPQQYKQPSRKGKKAWRKHVDISGVQEGLQLVREEEIKGGLVSEKPSEELFILDATGSQEVREACRKHKLLKSDEILAQRSAIPALDNRKRTNSKVTDGVIEPKAKRHRSNWIGHKEWLRLKEVAKATNPIRVDDNILHDPWADSKDASPLDDPQFDFLEKQMPVVAPPTLKQDPISLAVNGRRIPAVQKPCPGTSYNPSFEDWDKLLVKEGEKELRAEKKRLEKAREEEKRQRLISEAKENDDDEVRSDDESAWEGFESEYEKPEWLNKKRAGRKTQAQRNKIKRRKEAERKARWGVQMKERQQQAERIIEIAKEIIAKEAGVMQQEQPEELSDEGNDLPLRRRPLGKNFPPEKPLELVLPEELQDSLRLLKPEGNLLDDRFRNLIVQGKLEARKPVFQPKKSRRKLTEKWTYKDFKVPNT